MTKEEYDIIEYYSCMNCKHYEKGGGCEYGIKYPDRLNNHCPRILLIDNPKKIEEIRKKDYLNRQVEIFGYIKLDNYEENTRKFFEFQPFIYDKSNIFWIWNNDLKKYEMVDEIDIMIMLDRVLGLNGQTITKGVKSNYLEAFRRIGRVNIPQEPKLNWIQFKDKAFSITSKKIYDVTPHYFFSNPIPYEIGESSETPVMDKLFEEWVGKDNVNTLYEIIAYCCYRAYPIHIIFCFIGCGRNGKSRFLALLNKFIGTSNICSTELDTLLDSRFESFKLYKKLVCSMGETNFGVLNKTSLLKKLSGEDLIGFEYKQKVPFDDYNYAKILISSNSLPSSEDTSEGFYRRWMIIDFPNTFSEGKDILKTIPEYEYNNLARKVTEILPNLLESGKFTNQGNIEERKAKYILSSNPLSYFIDFACYKDYSVFVRYSELYTAYIKFLTKLKKRNVTKKEFGNVLTSEGYEITRTTKKIDDHYVNDRFVLGLGLKVDWEKFMTNMTFMHYFPTLFTYSKIKSKVMHKSHKIEKEEEIEEETITDE